MSWGFDLPGVGRLVDVESGEELRPAGRDSYRVTLKERRLRMFHAGPVPASKKGDA